MPRYGRWKFTFFLSFVSRDLSRNCVDEEGFVWWDNANDVSNNRTSLKRKERDKRKKKKTKT